MFEVDSDTDEVMPGRSPPGGRSFTSSSFSQFGGGELPLKEVAIKPRNDVQGAYLRALEAQAPVVVVAIGSAGTGKSWMACHAAWNSLVRGQVDRIVLTRPIVHVDDGEGIGFMPGGMYDKMKTWTAPLLDVFHSLVSPQRFMTLMDKEKIVICPLDLMRGRSFENCIILADECQNATPKQMLMLLTRIGKGSKLVITGDVKQHDRPRTVNGLSDFLQRVARYPADAGAGGDVAIFTFDERHVERHPFIKHVLKMYDAV
jgi:phosphate starvation-inducible PhoH-like protein